ncbi:helix-turn-helix transcriptional regulator [Marinicella rhabdoformis]|uniref:helix-turn-helix transcriptional regulator n=1 Tax=Marinicella rhabdoformis TaxID=2580566 RepID=UPI0015CFE93E|nr:helix-turn-helix transcriptional regulator [Marinicella rhabdoformis]
MSERTAYLIDLLASRLKDLRLKQNITQQELADMSGLSVKAIKGAEKGECHLKTFVAILIPLGADDLLENLFPEPLPSPVQMTKHGSKKMRARKKGEPDSSDESPDW